MILEGKARKMHLHQPKRNFENNQFCPSTPTRTVIERPWQSSR